jgi:hypothetical protein
MTGDGEKWATDLLADRVAVSSPFMSEERETKLLWARDEHDAHVETFELGLTRRFLSHPEFTPEHLHVTLNDGHARVERDEYDGRPIIGVSGRLPVGAVSVRGSSRKDTGHAEVVTERVLTGGSE